MVSAEPRMNGGCSGKGWAIFLGCTNSYSNTQSPGKHCPYLGP